MDIFPKKVINHLQRWQFMYFWLLNWIIYWIESLEFILNWIIVWIEFSETNIESNIELNQLSAKFKHWIESDRVSIRANAYEYVQLKFPLLWIPDVKCVFSLILWIPLIYTFLSLGCGQVPQVTWRIREPEEGCQFISHLPMMIMRTMTWI